VINRVTIGHEQRSQRDYALHEFPELADKPRTPRGVLIRDGLFIVAWFAYHGRESEMLVPGARRSWLMEFRRANGSAMSKKLTLLRNGWLRYHKTSNVRDAYEYALDTDIPDSERTKWVELGRILYEPDKGLVGHFLTRPTIKHGHVMMTGFLVFSVLERHGPMSATALKRALKPMLSRNTVATRVERLEAIGLITFDSDGNLSVVPEWEARLAEYEAHMGLDKWAQVQDAVILDERERADEEVQGGRAMVVLKKRLRGESCAVLGCPGGEVDHFPLKHWGGFDYPGLLDPICSGCNNDLGVMAKSIDRPRFVPDAVARRDWVGLAVDSEPLELARLLYWEARRQNDVRLLIWSRQLVEQFLPRLVAELAGSNEVAGVAYRDGEWVRVRRVFHSPARKPIALRMGESSEMQSVGGEPVSVVAGWSRQRVGSVEAESRRRRFTR
jgi:hypothetical protein